jgi:FkbM family methyltransferase
LILARLFPKRKGVYVEVGANDGITGSATYLFEKELDWTGVLVETHAELAERCKIARPNSCVFAYATVSPGTAHHVRFQLAPGDPQLSSLKISSDQMRCVPRRETVWVTVPALTLDEILEPSGISSRIDFVTIDVEGFERDVLAGLSLRAWAPRWILVENNGHFTDGWIARYMHRSRYALRRRTGVNEWWQHVGDGADS